MKGISLFLFLTLAGVLLVSAQDTTRVRFRVSVSDPSGRSVTGLKPENFRVRENGVERKVVSASLSDEPASVVIMIDVSDSFGRFLRRLAVNLLQKSFEEMNPKNEYLIVAFGEKTYSLFDWSISRSQMKTTLEEVAAIEGRGERTLLYDAIAAGITKLESGTLPRKFLVVVSDGQDNFSKITLKEIKNTVKRVNFPIYALGIVDSRDLGSFEGRYGLASLDEIASISGGYDFGTLLKYDDPDFAVKLANGLKSQFVVEWETTVSKTDMKWREVDVDIVAPELKKNGKNLKFISREGYFPDALPVGN